MSMFFKTDSFQKDGTPHLPFLLQSLRSGIDIHQKGPEGETLLHHLAGQGWVEGARFLCQTGALVNALDHKKRTPMYWAVCNGHYSMALLLLSLGADCRKTPAHDRLLIRAIEANSLPLVQLLLDDGANPNEGNKHGWFSPLAVAVCKNPWSPSMIKILLEAGAHPDAALFEGEVVAHEVARRKEEKGASEIWETLIQYGAHLDLPNQNGVCPLDLWSSLNSPLNSSSVSLTESLLSESLLNINKPLLKTK